MNEKKLMARMVELGAQMRAIRQDIHRHPELAYEEKRTAAIGTHVPPARTPVSSCSAEGQKNCENTTAPEAEPASSVSTAIAPACA